MFETGRQQFRSQSFGVTFGGIGTYPRTTARKCLFGQSMSLGKRKAIQSGDRKATAAADARTNRTNGDPFRAILGFTHAVSALSIQIDQIFPTTLPIPTEK